ncbi:hypothetical protein CCP4SC76_6840001 [Gammaproteobacteria bacterium]
MLGSSGHPGNGCLNNTITLKTNVTVTGVMKRLIDSSLTLTNDGTTRTLSGGGAYRPLFVKSGTVTLKNLTLSSGKAKGGNSSLGGAGAGLGGALFVYGGAVSVVNVNFTNNAAEGGSFGNSPYSRAGGGMFGNGRNLTSDAGTGGGLFESGDAGGYGGTGNYGGGNGLFGGGGGGHANPGGFGGGGAAYVGEATVNQPLQNPGDRDIGF